MQLQYPEEGWCRMQDRGSFCTHQLRSTWLSNNISPFPSNVMYSSTGLGVFCTNHNNPFQCHFLVSRTRFSSFKRIYSFPSIRVCSVFRRRHPLDSARRLAFGANLVPSLLASSHQVLHAYIEQNQTYQNHRKNSREYQT
jgi:hypothetical protein